MKELNIFGPSRKGISNDITTLDLLNCFMEIDPSNKHGVSFIGAPGLRFLAHFGPGPIRKIKTFKNHLYVVSGSDIYKVDRYFNYDIIGTLNTSSGRASMAQNGVQLIIVDGPFGYVWDDTDFQQITDPAFTGADFVVFKDGYFVFSIPDSGKYGISSAYDGLSYDALDYKTAEAAPDDLLALVVSEDYLWPLGAETTEVHYNAGSRFPFQRSQNGVMNWGIIAPDSAAYGDNSVIWLSRNEHGSGVICQAYGPGSPKVISTKGMAHEFKSFSDLSDAYAFCYLQGGEYFYQITFKAENRTFVYQLGIKQWFERKRWDGGHHRASCHTFFTEAGLNIVGDYKNGKIYALELDTYSEDGDRILRQLDSRIISGKDKRLKHNSLILDFETGVGNDDDPEPCISLEYSDNNGRRYSHPIIRSLGKKGEYSDPPRINRLGSSVNRVYKLKCTDRVKFRLSGVYGDIK